MGINLASNSECMLVQNWEFEQGWCLDERNAIPLFQGAGNCWARYKMGQDWANYIFHCRLKLVCGGVHLNYRVSEAGRYFIGLRQESLYLCKEHPRESISELVQHQFAKNLLGWHDVSICGEGGHLQVYVDGALEIDYIDSEPLLRGGIALETLEDSLSYVKNISATLASMQIIELELGNLLAVQEACRPWVIGSKAQERFKKGGAALNKALQQAESNNPEAIQHFVCEAEAGYRDALLSGLQVGLITHIKRYHEEVRPNLSPEKYMELVQRLEKAEAYYREALIPDKALDEVLKLAEKIENELLSGTILPDLVVKLYEIPYSQNKGIIPYPPLTDRPTALSVVIENIGPVSIDKSFQTELYVDGALTQTWNFPSEDESQDLKPGAKILIKPGGSRIYSYEVSFPLGGQHHFAWVVDAKNEILESDKTNNKLEFDLVWQAPPDLVVEDIWPVGTTAGGQASTWNIKVTNKGKGDAKGPFLTSFVPEIPGGSCQNFWTQSLQAGKSITFTSKQKFYAWGQRTLRAKVDEGNSVVEALPNGETNNELAKTFDLNPVDLEVKNLVVNQGPESTIFNFTVVNNGPGEATWPFKMRIWPGKVVQPDSSKSSNYLVQSETIMVNPLKAGQSVTLKHTVPLPAGKYAVAIEADYPDPVPVYFEPNRNNNVFTQKVVIVEKYFIKIVDIKYTTSCKEGFEVWIDRSGSYWKGLVVLKLTHKGKFISEKKIWPNDNVAVFEENTTDLYIENNDYEKTYQFSLEVYAYDGKQLIKSSLPDLTIEIQYRPQPLVDSISPSKIMKGKSAKITIHGARLSTPIGWTDVWAGFIKSGTLYPDSEVHVSVEHASYSEIKAEVNVSSNATAGKRCLYINACSSKWVPSGLEIVSEGIPVPKPETPIPPKKSDLCIFSFGCSPGFPKPGEAFTFAFTGANIGSAQAAASTVKVVLSGNANQAVNIPLQSVPPGVQFIGSWPFPSGLAEGNYFFEVILDYEVKLDELTRGNNWCRLGIVIM